MEHGVFRAFKRTLERLGAYRRSPGRTYSDGCILTVHFFAVLSDRPVSWACQRQNLPRSFWRGTLPDQSTMSRRMREPRLARLQKRVEHLLKVPMTATPLVAAIDGKPLCVALHSRDPHAKIGRGAGQFARGYKLHAVVDGQGALLCWRLAGLDRDERIIARRLLRDMPQTCYVLGDANYDSNPLHTRARLRGMQLIAPRKTSHRGRGLGVGGHDPARLRSIELLERGCGGFGQELLKARLAVERLFANLTNSGGSLTCLPPWVRTYPRVLAWVTGKVVIALLKGTIKAARTPMAA